MEARHDGRPASPDPEAPASPLLPATPVRVGVLGPLELLVDGRPVRLGGPKERAVLAMLALADGDRLSRQALVDGLWVDPPRTAERTVAAYLSRLRRRVAEARPGSAPGAPVIDEHPSGGTSLLPEAAGLDVAVARGFATRGQAAAAAGDHAWAAIAFGQALGLWRGEPLSEFDDEPFAGPARARLHEMRTTLLEQRIEAELHCGQHLVVVEELEDLVRRHPHRERLHAQLMLGLYRCGRQAEALQVYDGLRHRLQDELGVDPSPALSALQGAVLRQDSALDLPDAVVANASPGDPVRMSGVLTFLLTDIEDSTALWDAEPAAMARALEVHDRLVREHVAAHGGRTVQAQGEGDSTLNVFSRASDAVAVAVELREALAAHEWPGEIAMRVRLACHTGEAQQRDGFYLGPTINRAARLRGLAAGGEIVLSEATAAVVADVLPHGCWLEDVGERRLRGLRRLERVFLLRGGQRDHDAEVDGAWSRDARESLAAMLLDHDRGELHGRHAEKERLRALVRPGEEHAHRLTLIAGEPGIGKTRLAAWLAREALVDGTLVLYGRCRADLDPPFGAFLEAIGRFAARCPVAELRRHVGTDAGELARLVPELRERLATTASAAPPDPSAERYLLLRAVAGVLRSVSQAMPLLLVLDDLHWASPSTLVLLEHLVHDEPARRLSVVGTYRDTDVRAADPLSRLIADHASAIEHLQLGGLDIESVTAWVGDAVGEPAHGDGRDALTERVARVGAEIHHATAGTPFFVAEAMLRLRAGGLSATLDDDSADAATLALSDGSRGAVQRRLAGLSADANMVLAVAAVVGDEFRLDLVEAVPEVNGIDVVGALDEAVKARIVAEVPGAWGVYRFTHALLQQAVYTSLSDPRRVRLHRRVGEAIELRAGPDVAAHADALARHFAEAAVDGQSGKAADAALLAAGSASDRLGFEEAVAAVRRGLSALDLPGADDPARRCDLLTALAAAHQRLLDRTSAKEAALAAVALARELGDRERFVTAALHATPDRWLGAADDDVVDLLNEVLPTLDPRAPERPRLLALLAVQAAASGQGWNAGPIAEEALALARALPEGEPLCAALDARCWTLWGSAETLTVLALSSELIDIAHRCRLHTFVASGHFWRAQARLGLGDGDGFGSDLAALGDAASLTGSGIDRFRYTMLNVLRALLDGRYDEVETLAEAQIAGAKYDPDFLYAHFAQIFWLAFERGTLADFAPMLSGVDDAFAALPALMGVRALVLSAVGDLAGAAAVLASPAARGLEEATGEVSWPGMIGLMTEVVMECEAVAPTDGVIAAILERQATPFAERLLVVGGAICTGAGARYLGMLASLREDLAAVDRHFTTALRLEAAAGSEPLQARTRYWYARSLLRCGGEDERARAVAILGQSYAAAHRLGMAGLEKDVVRALDAL